VISALGNDTPENLAALQQGKSGISRLPFIESKYSGVLPFGGISPATPELRDQMGVTASGVTRTSLLALHAFREAIADAQLTRQQVSMADTAVIDGTTVGGMCLTDEFYQDATGNGIASPYLSRYDCASVSLFLQSEYGLQGIINTINTACSSSANAILYGARLIRNGLARRAIVGGTDSLSKITINGFNALHILSDEYCLPFDRDRKGLNLGEGAAFLVIEKEEDLRGRKVWAELTGYCNSTDAFHPSSLSAGGDGPALAMSGALQLSGLQPEQIGFINAHGTATGNNDESESRAMIRVFGTVPPFGSTKSGTGHTLGAAGAIEAVYSILSLKEQQMFPQLRFSEPIPETGLRPETTLRPADLQHVMSNSFGFGGNCTSLIFSKS